MPSREGLPVNAVFALKTNGIDENGYPLFVNKKGETVNAQTFFALFDPYADFFPGVLSQSKLTDEDTRNLFTYAGDLDPKFTGGFINTFKVVILILLLPLLLISNKQLLKNQILMVQL